MAHGASVAQAREWAGLPRPAAWAGFIRGLLTVIEVAAAVLLVADLLVVVGSVLGRHLLAAPLVWSDDVARTLLLAVTFLGAAAALARGENAGVTFFVDRLPPRIRDRVDAAVAVLIVIVAASLCWNTVLLLEDTAGQTVGAGIPQELFFAPLGAAGAAMTLFALDLALAFRLGDIAASLALFVVIAAAWLAWSAWTSDALPSMPAVMGTVFVGALVAGVPIAFVLALTTLVFVWSGDILPGEFFAQQLARGIDNFVLLAVPFFIFVGYLMEANGMSVRLISLLQRGAGRIRGGLDVVMVLSMVIFSGISGSKMADIAAVGSVLVPAARKSGQKPGEAVALLAASAVMAETIPPCVNLIILGFVANLSIGGLFMAGLLPSALMALALIGAAIVIGRRTAPEAIVGASGESVSGMAVSGIAAFGLIALIFGGYRSGFATATEISAFAVAYALLVGALLFREMSWRGAGARPGRAGGRTAGNAGRRRLRRDRPAAGSGQPGARPRGPERATATVAGASCHPAATSWPRRLRRLARAEHAVIPVARAGGPGRERRCLHRRSGGGRPGGKPGRRHCRAPDRWWACRRGADLAGSCAGPVRGRGVQAH